jgi:hypothetical protein
MILNVWSTHIILKFKLPIDDVNTCGTFRWHINIGNIYFSGLFIIQIFIVHILQMLKFVHMVQMVHMFFMAYETPFPFLQMVHISMGLIFKMCTHVYTFIIFKHVHV